MLSIHFEQVEYLDKDVFVHFLDEIGLKFTSHQVFVISFIYFAFSTVFVAFLTL